MLYRALLFVGLLMAANAILVQSPGEVQAYIVQAATDCKAKAMSCSDCEQLAVFIYNNENRDSPDFVPLDNMVRWKLKFKMFCLAIMSN